MNTSNLSETRVAIYGYNQVGQHLHSIFSSNAVVYDKDDPQDADVVFVCADDEKEIKEVITSLKARDYNGICVISSTSPMTMKAEYFGYKHIVYAPQFIDWWDMASSSLVQWVGGEYTDAIIVVDALATQGIEARVCTWEHAILLMYTAYIYDIQNCVLWNVIRDISGDDSTASTVQSMFSDMMYSTSPSLVLDRDVAQMVWDNTHHPVINAAIKYLSTHDCLDREEKQ